MKKSVVENYTENIFIRCFSRVEAVAYATNDMSYFRNTDLAEAEADKIESTKQFKELKEELLAQQHNDEYCRWNKDRALDLLIYCAEKCKVELSTKGVTQPRVNGLVTAIKELNTICGIYEDTDTNVRVFFTGEENIK